MKMLLMVAILFLSSGAYAEIVCDKESSNCVEEKTIVVQATYDLDSLLSRDAYYEQREKEIDEETARDAARNAEAKSKVVFERAKNKEIIERLVAAGAKPSVKLEETNE